ncbi:MAG: AI-2E family transporter [Acidimicrobiia bacterium]|nr:AI-2E family transporter [Actinomycetota bacterium]NDC90656.1 AI-2E family transporter [Acidimicrobiia bacterium]
MSHAESKDLNENEKMPRWVPRAILLFWAGFIATLVVRELFHQLTNFLILLLISLFFALAIEPAVNRLAARGWSRGSATTLMLLSVFVAVASFGAAIGTLVATQAQDLFDNREQYVTDTVEFINDTFNTSINSQNWVESISDPNGSVQNFFENQQDRVVDVSLGALSGLLQVFSITLFAFYLIADGPRLRRSICSRLSAEKQKTVLAVWNLAVQKTGGYIYSRALLAVVSAFFHWIVFQTIGTPAPVALAVWVGLISQFLPVVGTYLAGVLPVLLAFLDSPVKALIVIVFIAVYQQLENFLLAPKITAQTLELHAAVAFGAAIAGGAILGPIGAVLALPFAAMVQGIVGNWGRRFEIIDDPLVGAPASKKSGERKFLKK